MHGVRRGTRPTPEALQLERERTSFLADLIKRALVVRCRSSEAPFDEAFERDFSIVQRALEANPDEYTLWAFRREVLLAKTKLSSSLDQEWSSELEFTTRALQRHPKAYPAWQHRFWLLDSGAIDIGVSQAVRTKAIQGEEFLSALMLSKDGRNFHGWAHRMRVRSIKDSQNTSAEEATLRKELEFVEDKINEDFANYSAWHHRSALLPKIYRAGPQSFLSKELHFVRQAFYTEPEVQSAWFYHRWLLGGAPARGKKAVIDNDLLEDELVACEELIAIEPEARYALQTKVSLLLSLGRGSDALSTLDALERLVSDNAESVSQNRRTTEVLTNVVSLPVQLRTGSYASWILSISP